MKLLSSVASIIAIATLGFTIGDRYHHVYAEPDHRQPHTSASGTVTNPDGIAIRGVRVTVRRRDSPIGITYSNGAGSYTVEYASGTPISIWYHHTEYHEKVLPDLSGELYQEHSPVMRPRGQGLDGETYKEVLGDLRNYVRVAFAAGRTERAIASLNEYLAASGREAGFYREALELLDSAEVSLRHEEEDRRRAEVERRRATRWPPGSVFRDCETCPEMVILPGSAVALGRYEVTLGEYRVFASATGLDGHLTTRTSPPTSLAELHDAGRPPPSAGDGRRRGLLPGPASPENRAQPGEPNARVLAGYRRTSAERGRGQARPLRGPLPRRSPRRGRSPPKARFRERHASVPGRLATGFAGRTWLTTSQSAEASGSRRRPASQRCVRMGM